MSSVVVWFVVELSELCVVDIERFVSVFVSVVSMLDDVCSSVCLSVGLSFALTSFFLRFGAVLKAITGLSGNISLNVGSLRIGFQCL